MKKLMIGLVSTGVLFTTGCDSSNEYQAKAYELSNRISELEEIVEEKEATISELEEKSEYNYEEAVEEIATEETAEPEVAAEPARSEIEQNMITLLELEYYMVELDSTSKTFTIVASGIWAWEIDEDMVNRADSQWFMDIVSRLNSQAYHIYENLGAGYTVNMFDLHGELLAVNISGQPIYDYLTHQGNLRRLHSEISLEIIDEDFYGYTTFERVYEEIEIAIQQHLQGDSHALKNFSWE